MSQEEILRNLMARKSLAEIATFFVSNNNLSQEKFWQIQEKVLQEIKKEVSNK